ncbi:MAG: hypothetical protein ACLR13_07410 [Acutalibacteraceae bacterium]
MLLHMEEMGLETTFDRFDAQQPQCTFGIAGTCCKNCFITLQNYKNPLVACVARTQI